MSIVAEKVSYVYMPGSPFEAEALSDVSFTIEDGEFVGVIGHTGSGKSTLVQHFNALIKPTSGKMTVQGVDIGEKGVSLNSLRQKVGLVFQYPEYQLFEETVEKDVAFGPKNLGLPEEEILNRVAEAMRLVGLDQKKIGARSPFELSGGQRRRVALAGVLAMNPEVLILDEPSAGLDPHGRNEILALVSAIHEERGCTVIMVSHSMDEVARVASRVMVMNHGHLVMDGTPRQIYTQGDQLQQIGLGVPATVQLSQMLRSRGMDVPEGILSLQEMAQWIQTQSKEAGHV